MLRRLSQSLIFQLGLVMLAIVALAILGTSSSLLISETIEGKAEGVNIAGSLRMQSYRIASTLLYGEAQEVVGHRRNLALLIDTFQLTLRDPSLLGAMPSDNEDPLQQSYTDVVKRWHDDIRPLLATYLTGVARQSVPTARPVDYIEQVPLFVADIDQFVARLAHDTELKVLELRRYQFVLLLITLLLTVLALLITWRKVHRPLKLLLQMARSTGQGDFSMRTDFQGDDELGRLGAAFNSMSEDLGELYANLESLVEEKTEDLERSRRSLELLYRTAQALGVPVMDNTVFTQLLCDIETLAETGPGMICLTDNARQGASTLASTYQHDGERNLICSSNDCESCFRDDRTHEVIFPLSNGDNDRMIAFPISDGTTQHGVLLVQLPEGRQLAEWQRPLLEAVAGHIDIALTRAGQVSEQRRLALLEERGVIARELHDSLAQALSYLKIQITRLQSAVDRKDEASELTRIIDELREGIGSAYRELRELLTTFRLRMEEQSLAQALQATADEFMRRNPVTIDLQYQIRHSAFTPNEEIHLLHIVREALSNVVHHSGASSCTITLEQPNGNNFELRVEDNGSGFGTVDDNRQHYGLTIMRERAASLQAEIDFQTGTNGGACVRVTFLPEIYRNAATKP